MKNTRCDKFQPTGYSSAGVTGVYIHISQSFEIMYIIVLGLGLDFKIQKEFSVSFSLNEVVTKFGHGLSFHLPCLSCFLCFIVRIIAFLVTCPHGLCACTTNIVTSSYNAFWIWIVRVMVKNVFCKVNETLAFHNHM